MYEDDFNEYGRISRGMKGRIYGANELIDDEEETATDVSGIQDSRRRNLNSCALSILRREIL